MSEPPENVLFDTPLSVAEIEQAFVALSERIGAIGAALHAAATRDLADELLENDSVLSKFLKAHIVAGERIQDSVIMATFLMGIMAEQQRHKPDAKTSDVRRTTKPTGKLEFPNEKQFTKALMSLRREITDSAHMRSLTKRFLESGDKAAVALVAALLAVGYHKDGEEPHANVEAIMNSVYDNAKEDNSGKPQLVTMAMALGAAVGIRSMELTGSTVEPEPEPVAPDPDRRGGWR